MTSFSVPDLKEKDHIPTSDALVIPEDIDWFGYDCYERFRQCTESTITKAMERLDALRRREQHFVLFLDATYENPQSIPESSLERRNNLWLRLAQKLPVSGYFVFI